MGRINKFPDDSWEDLLSRYEAMKVSGKYGYLDAEEIADLASHYLNLMNTDEAAHVIEYGLKLHPDNSVIRIEQGFYYLDTNQLDKAQEIVDSLPEDDSEEIIFLKAELFLINKKVDEAKKMFETLEYAKDEELIIRIAYVWLDLQFPEEVISFLHPFLDKFPDEEDLLAIYAEATLQIGRPGEALTYYNRLLDKQPYSAPYWVCLARCYYDLKEYGKCIEACDFALAADEEFSTAHLFKGDALFMLDEDEKALEEYEKSATYESMPSLMNAMFIGLKYFSQEKYKESIPHFLRIIHNTSPERDIQMRISAFHYLPFAFLVNGQIMEARLCCDEWIGLTPEDPYAHLMNARVCVAERDIYTLQDAAWKTIDLSEEATPPYEIGEICIQAGLYEYAKVAFEKAKSFDSQFRNINLELLSVYAHLKDKENIRNLLTQVEDEWAKELMEYFESCDMEEEERFMHRISQQIDQLRENPPQENNSGEL